MNETEKIQELEHRVGELQNDIEVLRRDFKKFYSRIEQILDDHNMI